MRVSTPPYSKLVSAIRSYFRTYEGSDVGCSFVARGIDMALFEALPADVLEDFYESIRGRSTSILNKE